LGHLAGGGDDNGEDDGTDVNESKDEDDDEEEEENNDAEDNDDGKNGGDSDLAPKAIFGETCRNDDTEKDPHPNYLPKGWVLFKTCGPMSLPIENRRGVSAGEIRSIIVEECQQWR
jgi:hypothetical protein